MLVKGLVRGATAGAAGTTALNIVSGLDAAARARPASQAPTKVVEALLDAAELPVPRDPDRLAALGPLAGTAAGLAVGSLAGGLRALGVRLPTVLGGPLLGATAMLATDAPLVLAKVSDPRSWSREDWVADILPHLAYGLVTHRTLTAMAQDQDGTEPAGRLRVSTLLRSALLGAATGLRSSAGITALAMSSRRGDPGRVASWSGSGLGKVGTGLLAVGEAVLDKQPSAPDRTAGPALLSRVVLAGVASAGLAARRGDDPDLPALVGTVSAVATTGLGVRMRAQARQKFGSDLPGALLEDALAALLGWRAVFERPAAGTSPV